MRNTSALNIESFLQTIEEKLILQLADRHFDVEATSLSQTILKISVAMYTVVMVTWMKFV